MREIEKGLRQAFSATHQTDQGGRIYGYAGPHAQFANAAKRKAPVAEFVVEKLAIAPLPNTFHYPYLLPC